MERGPISGVICSVGEKSGNEKSSNSWCLEISRFLNSCAVIRYESEAARLFSKGTTLPRITQVRLFGLRPCILTPHEEYKPKDG